MCRAEQAKHNSICDDSPGLVSVFALSCIDFCLLSCERLDTLFGLTHGFCNKAHAVKREGEKMSHARCQSSKVIQYLVPRSCSTLGGKMARRALLFLM